MRDPLSDRRSLAMLAAFNGFFVFPLLVAWFSHAWHLSDELCKHLLNYMGVTMLAPIMGFLYSAHRNDDKRREDANTDKV